MNALVTGGGSGIGEAIARRLATGGHRVCVTGRRGAVLERLAGEIDGVWAVGDTGVPEEAERVVATAVAELGGLDALVCNAGISHSGSVTQQTPESWERVMRTNLTGAFLVARAALPHLEAAGGSIVTIASLSGLVVGAESAAYSTSKAGMVMLTKSIALDYGPRGVRANCICPGWIRTDMADACMDDLATKRGTDREGAYALVHDRMPMPRPGTAEEVAAVAAFLVSPEASYLNGVVIPVDGGTSVVDLGLMEFAP